MTRNGTITRAVEKLQRESFNDEKSDLGVPLLQNSSRVALSGKEGRSLMLDGEQRKANELTELKIIHPEMEECSVLDSFRDLRTNLLHRIRGENFILLTTGVKHSSGSSFVAKNLAAAFALDETRTAVLIDCDLRYPSHVDLVNGATKGIVEYLEDDETELSEIIYKTGIKRLRVIPCVGKRESPSEYFSFPRMKEFFQDLKHRYPDRYLIVDAPPASEAADIRMLSELVDYVLLVVPYGKVTERQIEKVTRAIPDEKLVGVVFNDEPE